MATQKQIRFGCLLLALMLLLTSGCTRRFFRQAADKDVDNLLGQKDQDPRWKIEQFHVYPDPRARFADWTNPDRPPMPPDDLAAKILSPNPQKPYHKAGVDYIEGKGYLDLLEAWDAQNRQAKAGKGGELAPMPKEVGEKGEKKMIGAAGPTVPEIDVLNRPELQNELADPVTTTGLLPPSREPTSAKRKPYLLTMDQAVELGTINAREYQTQRESLYLSALPVSLERFAFVTQFYATEVAIRESAGKEFPGGQRNTWSLYTTGGLSQLFPTGALLLAQFANQTVVNLGNMFNGGRVPTTSQSTVALDLVQPFLRGGGFAVTLEPLTQAERNLLYSVRDYARFRQQFYAYIAVGQSAFIPGVQAGVPTLTAGTVQTPNPAVPNATPLVNGVGGPNIQVAVPPGLSPNLGAIGPSGANPQGYLNTLIQKAQLISFVKNVHALDYYFKLLQAYQEGGIVNPVQVGQIEQRLLGGIDTMLTNWTQYRSSLDLFRIQLGLPTNLPLELDDAPLQPMYDLIKRYEDNSTFYALAVNESQGFDRIDEPEKLRGRLRTQMTTAALVEGMPFQKEAVRRWAEWEKLPKTADVAARLRELSAERRKLQDRKAELDNKKQPMPPAELQRLDDLTYEISLGFFEEALRKYETQPWKGQDDPRIRRNTHSAAFLLVHRSYVPLLSQAVKERLAYIRGSWPALPAACVNGVDLLSAEEDLALNTVVAAALENRLDLMNQKAQLVDSWRKLRVAANALLGTFNVEYHMDALTPPGVNEPFAFSQSRSRHQLIFNGQLPLVRRFERNVYRSTLIAYQQARRNWMEAQDQVAFGARFQLRNLRIAAYNYHRVQKRNMELAYLQVDQALQAFSQPVAPAGPAAIGVGPPTAGGSQGDPAALTQQLLNVQSSLVSAQTDLYGQWLGYLQNRIYLYRDLGIMPLDSRGVWIDDAANCNSLPQGNPGPVLLQGPFQSGPFQGARERNAQRPGGDDEPAILELLPPTQVAP